MLGACSILGALIAARGAGQTIRKTVAAALVVAIVAFFVTAPASLPRLKLSGRDRLLHLSEGAFGSVAVVVHNGHRRIVLNNFYVLGGTHAAGDERLQGHIPLLLHPQPQRVAFLGLGTGDFFQRAPVSSDPRGVGARARARGRRRPRAIGSATSNLDVLCGSARQAESRRRAQLRRRHARPLRCRRRRSRRSPGGAESPRSTRASTSTRCVGCWRRAGCTVSGFRSLRSRKPSSTALPRRSSMSSRRQRSGEGTSAPDKPRSR